MQVVKNARKLDSQINEANDARSALQGTVHDFKLAVVADAKRIETLEMQVDAKKSSLAQFVVGEPNLRPSSTRTTTCHHS